MASKRFKKLPEKTSNLPAESIEKLITVIKKNCTTKFDTEEIVSIYKMSQKEKII